MKWEKTIIFQAKFFQHIIFDFLIGCFQLGTGGIQLVQVLVDLYRVIWFLLGQKNNRLHMHRLWELIHSADLLQFISIITQESQISGECRTVTAHIDNSLRLHFEDGFKQHFIAALSRGIDYDHICIDAVFLIFSWQNLFGFSDKEFYIFDIIDLYCGIGTISLFLAQKARFVRGEIGRAHV